MEAKIIKVNLMKYNFIETIMGALVLIIAVSFVIFGINTAKINTENEIIISALFENVAGLKIGDNVKISGIDIGKIVDLKLTKETYEAQVWMSLEKNISLPEDTSARITSSNLLGGSYVEIIPGVSEKILQNNETIYDTTSSVSFTDLLGKMIFSNNK